MKHALETVPRHEGSSTLERGITSERALTPPPSTGPLMLHLVTALMLMQQTSATISVDSKSGASVVVRSSEAKDDPRADSVARVKHLLRPATAAEIASAYTDVAARELITRARHARDIQDSSVLSYDANTLQMISAGLAVTRWGRDRLMFRYQSSSHIRWERGVGASVEITGRRAAAPLLGDSVNVDIDDIESPVPYFPGRDALWVGSSVAHAIGSTDDLIHPLARGAEVYYRYSSGDSITLALPDSTKIRLREVDVRPRVSAWNVIVGALWFDQASGQLVRAAYKLAQPLEFTVGHATITGFAVEYGLRDGKYWLPRSQSADGEIQVEFVRVPLRIEETFTYASVNVAGPTAAVTLPPRVAAVPLDTTALAGLTGSARAARRAHLVASRDSAARAQQCQTIGSTVDRVSRYDGLLIVGVSVPCDKDLLARSPTLPPSIFASGDSVFADADLDALLQQVSGMLPVPGWTIRPPDIDWGLSFERYNRVEGLSSAVRIHQPVGAGVSVDAQPRFGFGDRVFNADLAITAAQPFGITLDGYRRLSAANDWGNPLDFGSSLSAILFGRDEGFYYRAQGAELRGEHDGRLHASWRIFDEQQLEAPTRTNWSVPEMFGSSGFTPAPNIVANPTRESGAALRLGGSTGLDPEAWRTLTDARLEGAGGGFRYGRAAADLTVSHGLAWGADAALTLSGGTSTGTVPTQRLWYLGGTATVRGESPGAMAGNAYWRTRAEVGRGSPLGRVVLFSDLGWAGTRDAWRQVGRPLSGVGAGCSALDGVLRLDVARGLYPVAQWRVSLYLDGTL